MTCSLCGNTNGCSCQVARLLMAPHYSQPCGSCPEDHDKVVVAHRYSAAVKVANAWVIPAENQLSTLYVPALVDIVPGCALWHPTYGFFRVVSYDPEAQIVKVERAYSGDNASAAGTPIPSCTSLVVTVDPDALF